ncbi:MAG: ThiF family adenylyltransferase, partial [Proteobacteria bacterium]|nr:ThiF family adenylyltransferase [Pseudomonadota bacterium]
NKQGKPWVFTGILGAQGQTMAIIPGKTKRLKDIFNYENNSNNGNFSDIEPNTQSSVIAPSVSIMASIAVILCFRVLLNNCEDIINKLFVFDTWENKFKILKM